ncbi:MULTISPECIES: hypothetical protein [Enterobacteriaceae]|jgi:hypothetical protein|nr:MULTISPECIES: hypothetical protein [Enterobacteriaceae]MCF6692423.1 hypothetical protein [Raoultella terrigena]MDM9661306.1 hypothetical protein [Raoultella planticola]EIX9053446.1 hypothetical protein [Klebsiella oxytoca]KAB8128199.1 hypothetical protein FNH10_26655 [Raoultella ornithinolytica]MBC4622085.1 hypothetical protein [Klebsiella pneumoniae]
MIFKEEIVLGIYSWLHMTPVSILVRNITSDGGSFAIVRLTVDSRGVQMGPKAQGQLLCSFSFNVDETYVADTEEGPRIMKAEMMNAVMQIVPDYIELTDRQTHAIREEVSVFDRVCAMRLTGGHGSSKSLWENDILPRMKSHSQLQ